MVSQASQGSNAPDRPPKRRYGMNPGDGKDGDPAIRVTPIYNVAPSHISGPLRLYDDRSGFAYVGHCIKYRKADPLTRSQKAGPIRPPCNSTVPWTYAIVKFWDPKWRVFFVQHLKSDEYDEITDDHVICQLQVHTLDTLLSNTVAWIEDQTSDIRLVKSGKVFRRRDWYIYSRSASSLSDISSKASSGGHTQGNHEEHNSSHGIRDMDFKVDAQILSLDAYKFTGNRILVNLKERSSDETTPATQDAQTGNHKPALYSTPSDSDMGLASKESEERDNRLGPDRSYINQSQDSSKQASNTSSSPFSSLTIESSSTCSSQLEARTQCMLTPSNPEDCERPKCLICKEDISYFVEEGFAKEDLKTVTISDGKLTFYKLMSFLNSSLRQPNDAFLSPIHAQYTQMQGIGHIKEVEVLDLLGENMDITRLVMRHVLADGVPLADRAKIALSVKMIIWLRHLSGYEEEITSDSQFKVVYWGVKCSECNEAYHAKCLPYSHLSKGPPFLHPDAIMERYKHHSFLCRLYGSVALMPPAGTPINHYRQDYRSSGNGPLIYKPTISNEVLQDISTFIKGGQRLKDRSHMSFVGSGIKERLRSYRTYHESATGNGTSLDGITFLNGKSDDSIIRALSRLLSTEHTPISNNGEAGNTMVADQDDSGPVVFVPYLENRNCQSWKCESCTVCMYCCMPTQYTVQHMNAEGVVEEIRHSKPSYDQLYPCSLMEKIESMGLKAKPGNLDFVRCVSCNVSAHKKCCNPGIPELAFLESWRCEACLQCICCGYRDNIAPDYMNWGLFFLFCLRCWQSFEKNHYCGLCYRIWTRLDNTSYSWVQCEGCKLWVHMKCDGYSKLISEAENSKSEKYKCPTCRSPNRLHRLFRVLEIIFNVDRGNQFRYPMLETYSSYWQIVSHPMDLLTIRSKIEEGQYYSLEQFAFDVLLMSHNAKILNMPNTKLYKIAISFGMRCKFYLSSILDLTHSDLDVILQFGLRDAKYGKLSNMIERVFGRPSSKGGYLISELYNPSFNIEDLSALNGKELKDKLHVDEHDGHVTLNTESHAYRANAYQHMHNRILRQNMETYTHEYLLSHLGIPSFLLETDKAQQMFPMSVLPCGLTFPSVSIIYPTTRNRLRFSMLYTRNEDITRLLISRSFILFDTEILFDLSNSDMVYVCERSGMERLTCFSLDEMAPQDNLWTEFCVVCGSSAHGYYMVFCQICGEAFHFYCVGLIFPPQFVNYINFRCANCASCDCCSCSIVSNHIYDLNNITDYRLASALGWTPNLIDYNNFRFSRYPLLHLVPEEAVSFYNASDSEGGFVTRSVKQTGKDSSYHDDSPASDPSQRTAEPEKDRNDKSKAKGATKPCKGMKNKKPPSDPRPPPLKLHKRCIFYNDIGAPLINIRCHHCGNAAHMKCAIEPLKKIIKTKHLTGYPYDGASSFTFSFEGQTATRRHRVYERLHDSHTPRQNYKRYKATHEPSYSDKGDPGVPGIKRLGTAQRYNGPEAKLYVKNGSDNPNRSCDVQMKKVAKSSNHTEVQMKHAAVMLHSKEDHRVVNNEQGNASSSRYNKKDTMVRLNDGNATMLKTESLYHTAGPIKHEQQTMNRHRVPGVNTSNIGRSIDGIHNKQRVPEMLPKKMAPGTQHKMDLQARSRTDGMAYVPLHREHKSGGLTAHQSVIVSTGLPKRGQGDLAALNRGLKSHGYHSKGLKTISHTAANEGSVNRPAMSTTSLALPNHASSNRAVTKEIPMFSSQPMRMYQHNSQSHGSMRSIDSMGPICLPSDTSQYRFLPANEQSAEALRSIVTMATKGNANMTPKSASSTAEDKSDSDLHSQGSYGRLNQEHPQLHQFTRIKHCTCPKGESCRCLASKRPLSSLLKPNSRSGSVVSDGRSDMTDSPHPVKHWASNQRRDMMLQPLQNADMHALDIEKEQYAAVRDHMRPGINRFVDMERANSNLSLGTSPSSGNEGASFLQGHDEAMTIPEYEGDQCTRAFEPVLDRIASQKYVSYHRIERINQRGSKGPMYENTAGRLTDRGNFACSPDVISRVANTDKSNYSIESSDSNASTRLQMSERSIDRHQEEGRLQGSHKEDNAMHMQRSHNISGHTERDLNAQRNVPEQPGITDNAREAGGRDIGTNRTLKNADVSNDSPLKRKKATLEKKGSWSTDGESSGHQAGKPALKRNIVEEKDGHSKSKHSSADKNSQQASQKHGAKMENQSTDTENKEYEQPPEERRIQITWSHDQCGLFSCCNESIAECDPGYKSFQYPHQALFKVGRLPHYDQLLTEIIEPIRVHRVNEAADDTYAHMEHMDLMHMANASITEVSYRNSFITTCVCCGIPIVVPSTSGTLPAEQPSPTELVIDKASMIHLPSSLGCYAMCDSCKVWRAAFIENSPDEYHLEVLGSMILDKDSCYDKDMGYDEVDHSEYSQIIISADNIKTVSLIRNWQMLSQNLSKYFISVVTQSKHMMAHLAEEVKLYDISLNDSILKILLHPTFMGWSLRSDLYTGMIHSPLSPTAFTFWADSLRYADLSDEGLVSPFNKVLKYYTPLQNNKPMEHEAVNSLNLGAGSNQSEEPEEERTRLSYEDSERLTSASTPVHYNYSVGLSSGTGARYIMPPSGNSLHQNFIPNEDYGMGAPMVPEGILNTGGVITSSSVEEQAMQTTAYQFWPTQQNAYMSSAPTELVADYRNFLPHGKWNELENQAQRFSYQNNQTEANVNYGQTIVQGVTNLANGGIQYNTGYTTMTPQRITASTPYQKHHPYALQQYREVPVVSNGYMLHANNLHDDAAYVVHQNEQDGHMVYVNNLGEDISHEGTYMGDRMHTPNQTESSWSEVKIDKERSMSDSTILEGLTDSLKVDEVVATSYSSIINKSSQMTNTHQALSELRMRYMDQEREHYNKKCFLKMISSKGSPMLQLCRKWKRMMDYFLRDTPIEDKQREEKYPYMRRHMIHVLFGDLDNYRDDIGLALALCGIPLADSTISRPSSSHYMMHCLAFEANAIMRLITKAQAFIEHNDIGQILSTTRVINPVYNTYTRNHRGCTDKLLFHRHHSHYMKDNTFSDSIEDEDIDDKYLSAYMQENESNSEENTSSEESITRSRLGALFSHVERMKNKLDLHFKKSWKEITEERFQEYYMRMGYSLLVETVSSRAVSGDIDIDSFSSMLNASNICGSDEKGSTYILNGAHEEVYIDKSAPKHLRNLHILQKLLPRRVFVSTENTSVVYKLQCNPQRFCCICMVSYNTILRGNLLPWRNGHVHSECLLWSLSSGHLPRSYNHNYDRLLLHSRTLMKDIFGLTREAYSRGMGSRSKGPNSVKRDVARETGENLDSDVFNINLMELRVLPPVTLSDNDVMEIVDNAYDTRCLWCGDTGATVRCVGRKCRVYLHLSCALLAANPGMASLLYELRYKKNGMSDSSQKHFPVKMYYSRRMLWCKACFMSIVKGKMDLYAINHLISTNPKRMRVFLALEGLASSATFIAAQRVLQSVRIIQDVVYVSNLDPYITEHDSEYKQLLSEFEGNADMETYAKEIGAMITAVVKPVLSHSQRWDNRGGVESGGKSYFCACHKRAIQREYVYYRFGWTPRSQSPLNDCSLPYTGDMSQYTNFDFKGTAEAPSYFSLNKRGLSIQKRRQQLAQQSKYMRSKIQHMLMEQNNECASQESSSEEKNPANFSEQIITVTPAMYSDSESADGSSAMKVDSTGSTEDHVCDNKIQRDTYSESDTNVLKDSEATFNHNSIDINEQGSDNNVSSINSELDSKSTLSEEPLGSALISTASSDNRNDRGKETAGNLKDRTIIYEEKVPSTYEYPRLLDPEIKKEWTHNTSSAQRDNENSEVDGIIRSGALTILNIGDALIFDAANKAYPAGFTSVRIFWNKLKTQNRKTRNVKGVMHDSNMAPKSQSYMRSSYLCTVRVKERLPYFTIALLSHKKGQPKGSTVIAQGSRIEAVYTRFLKNICKEESHRFSVMEFFGLNHPYVVQELRFRFCNSILRRCLEFFKVRSFHLSICARSLGNVRKKLQPMLRYGDSASIHPTEAELDSIKSKVESVVDCTGLYPRRMDVTGAPIDLMWDRKQYELVTPNSQYMFLSSMIPEKRLEVRNSKIHGYGLFTTEPIASGDPVIEYVGELIREQIGDLREEEYSKEQGGDGSCYMFRLDDEMIVDATRRGSMSRFINHSCDPNCICRIVTCEKGQKHIVIFARVDLKPGDEITYDYKFGVEGEAQKLRCLCASSNCMGRMN